MEKFYKKHNSLFYPIKFLILVNNRSYIKVPKTSDKNLIVILTECPNL